MGRGASIAHKHKGFGSSLFINFQWNYTSKYLHIRENILIIKAPKGEGIQFSEKYLIMTCSSTQIEL